MTWTGAGADLPLVGLCGVSLLATFDLNLTFDRGRCIDEGEVHLGEGVMQVSVSLAILDGLRAAVSDLCRASNFLEKVGDSPCKLD